MEHSGLQKRTNWLLVFLACMAAAFILVGTLLYNGIIWFNKPSQSEYPVRGVDVSAYQGEIQWDVLARQGIDFVFIKATEGSSQQDERFAYNWHHAQQSALKIGAYHFFSYDSSGITQAQNFISTVPIAPRALPPVVDIEFYGDKEKNLPRREDTAPILHELLLALEEHYGQKPIIYATNKSYQLYIQGDYPDYPIWIRDVFQQPVLPDGRKWSFWQYSHRERLEGYSGEEKYIDVNVFNGTPAQFLETYGAHVTDLD